MIEYRLRGLPVRTPLWMWDPAYAPPVIRTGRVLESILQQEETIRDLEISHQLACLKKEAEELTASVHIGIPVTNARRKEPDRNLTSSVRRNFIFRRRKAQMWSRT